MPQAKKRKASKPVNIGKALVIFSPTLGLNRVRIIPSMTGGATSPTDCNTLTMGISNVCASSSEFNATGVSSQTQRGVNPKKKQ